MPTQTATSSPPPTAEPIPAGPVSVEVAGTEVGEVLVDGEGRTLYVFLVDRPGEPACLDACLDTWLPVYVKGKPAVGDGVGASVVGTSKRDGQLQLTIGDQYAYLYAGDESAGDTNGQGIESLWYAVAPDGTRVVGV